MNSRDWRTKTNACIAVALFITTVVALTFTYNHEEPVALQPDPWTTYDFINRTRDCTDCSHGEQLGDMTALGEVIRELYKPIVLPVSTQDFIDKESGKTYYTSEPVWEHLGKDLCIADIDTRSYSHDGQILSSTFSWDNTDALSAGMLNHFTYASIHGYSYHLVNSEPWPNNERDGVWSRVVHLRRLLDHCRIVATIDADVVFQHLELPFEWLLNRWNFTEETSIAMPWDVKYNIRFGFKTPMGWTNDSKGLLSINAGVVVAQNLTRTKEIVEAWIGCPEDPRFPDCAKLRHGWPAEQGAFANHIRYAYNETNDLRTIDCEDANGFPGSGNDCDGTFLRHFTSEKLRTKDAVGKIMLDSFTKIFASNLVRGKPST